MWAPADLYRPTMNAITLALKRATTLAWNNLLFLFIALGVLIAILVVIGQLRSRNRR